MNIDINELELQLCDNKNIIQVMKKISILAAKIGNNSFKEFINKEIASYPEHDDLPDYRILHNNIIKCSIGNDIRGYQPYDISTGQVPLELRENLENIKIRYPLSEILNALNEKNIDISIDPNYAVLLTEIGKYHEQNIEVKKAWLRVSSGQFLKIIESINIKLKEFLHELSIAFSGNLSSIDIANGAVYLNQTFNQFFQDCFKNNHNTGIIGNNNYQANHNSGTVIQNQDNSSADIHENDLNTIIETLQVLKSITTQNQEEFEIKKETIKKISSIIADGSKSKLKLVKDEILPTLANVATVFGPVISMLMGLSS